MERIGNKVSYIKKPFAKNSFVAAGLAAAALVFYAAAISFSYYTQGNAPLAAAARLVEVYSSAMDPQPITWAGLGAALTDGLHLEQGSTRHEDLLSTLAYGGQAA